jgi:glycosyltransferase involved in cell wall biosynthesis
MKVLYLVPDDGFFWSHRRDLAATVLKTGCEVLVATPEGSYRERIEADGFGFRPVRMSAGLSPLGMARTFHDLLRLYRAERPDLVHHVSMRSVLAGGLVARVTRVPSVVNLICGLGWVFSSGSRGLRSWVSWAYRLSLANKRSWTVFQNPDDKQQFLDRGLVSNSRSSVILGSGVETRGFQSTPEPEGPPSILFASRMLEPKGVADLVEAGRLLQQAGVEHTIVLAGEPDAKNPSSISKETLEAWVDEGLVRWLGHVDDVPALLGDCHLACLPSYYGEGLPRFLLEAMAAGRPIVTTDTPGCRELVPNEASGVLVQPRKPDELAAALGRLISDEQGRREMGRAGRELVDAHFTLDSVIAQTLDVYDEITTEDWR